MTESKKHTISLLLIQNTEKRLEKFKPLFEHLVKGGYGKLTSGHFSIPSKIYFSQPMDELQHTFNTLQLDSQRLGYTINCYCFNI